MTRSNRTLNRIVLLLCGLALLAGAGLAAWPWAARTFSVMRPPAVAAPSPAVLWWVVGGCAVLVVLALIWIVTRGRGGTPTAYAEDGVDLDIRVLRDLLHQDLATEPSVVGVDANAYRLRGRTAIAVRIRVRRGTELQGLLGDVRASVGALDAVVGSSLPLVIRLTASGGRDRRAE